jgi:hypothetical protein
MQDHQVMADSTGRCNTGLQFTRRSFGKRKWTSAPEVLWHYLLLNRDPPTSSVVTTHLVCKARFSTLFFRCGTMHPRATDGHCAAWITGGFHVPSPGGRIEGGVSFGQ